MNNFSVDFEILFVQFIYKVIACGIIALKVNLGHYAETVQRSIMLLVKLSWILLPTILSSWTQFLR